MPFPSSVRFPLGDWREEEPVVLRPAPAEEVPALPDGDHLLEVDPRRHELVTRRRGASEHLAERADDGAPRDQLDAVLDARLGDTNDEAEVRVGARPEAELVEVERQGRDGRVVADENDLGALEREGAVALRVAAVLADRDPDLGAGGVEDPVARVAVGEVVGLEDLGEPVRGLRAGQVDLAKRSAEASVPVGEERRVEVLSLGFLAEAHVHRDPRLGRAGEERLERLGRHLGLEELVEVGADLLGEVRRERHLRVGDQLDALPRRLGEQTQHPLDDLLAAGALVVGAQLRGGGLYMARHDEDRKSTRLNSSHSQISYAVFCLKKKKNDNSTTSRLAYLRVCTAPRRTRPGSTPTSPYGSRSPVPLVHRRLPSTHGFCLLLPPVW